MRLLNSFSHLNQQSGQVVNSGENRMTFLNRPEKRKTTQYSTVVYSGISNAIQKIENDLEREKDLSKRKELEQKRSECMAALEALKTAPVNEQEFGWVLSDIEADDNRIKRLETGEVDYLDLSELLGSDLARFLDQDSIGKIEIAAEQMTQADFALAAVGGLQRSEAMIQAEMEWEARGETIKDEAQAEIRELVDKELASKEAKKRWIRRRVIEIEKGSESSLVERVPLSAIERAKSIVFEASEIRKNAALEFLRQKNQKNKALLEKLQQKQPRRISKKQAEEIKAILDEIDEVNLTNSALGELDNPAYLKAVNEALDHVGVQIRDIEVQTQFLENPTEAKQGLEESLSEVERMIRSLSSTEIEQLQAEVSRDPNERNESPKIHRKKQEALEALKGGALAKEIELIRAQLSEPNLSPEETLSIQKELTQLRALAAFISGDRIDRTLNPEKQEGGEIASRLLRELQGVTNPVEIKRILEARLRVGENLEYVSSSKFEQSYRAYTTTGFMVFYERGNEWKIIINEEALENPENGAALNHQISHELLHLQFERTPEIKEAWVKHYTENASWQEIKTKFVEAYKTKQPPSYQGDKTEFSASDWKDEDVVSELYAMQRELGASSIKENGSKIDALKKAILTAGISQSALGLVDENDEPIIRGYESADDVMSSAPAEGGGEEGGESVSGSPEFFRDQIEIRKQQINNLLKSEYVGAVPGAKDLLQTMDNYLDETLVLNEAFEASKSGFLAGTIQERIDQVKEDMGTIEKAMGDVSENTPNQHLPLWRKLWLNTHFMSIEDIIQVAVDVKEWQTRRHTRKKADHAARIGAALFSKLPFIGGIGLEAEARAEKAEQEEVNEWKNRLENKDAWELIDILRVMSRAIDPNKDQFKAILRILADKGRIDWREPAIWVLLSKMQSATHLTPGDQVLLHNPVILRQKLHTACGEIWDYDEFLELEKSNESKYESKKNEYMATLDKIQDQITARLDQLLGKHRRGENVDPMEYEALIEYSIKNGKSYAENIFFHLVCGMADGLLPPDRGLSLDKHLNTWPATQWIYSKSPPMSQDDYLNVCLTKFKGSYERGSLGGENGDFMNFYWTEVQNDPMTIQRVRKSVSERVWDHDWGRSIACMGDANTAKRFFSGRSGQQEAKDTAVENSYVGALQWLEINAEDPGKIDARKEFARQMAWVAMADGIIDHVAYLRGANDIYTRGNASILDAKAREAGVGNHGDWNTRQHRNKIRGFLDRFDPTFFAMIRNTSMARNNPEQLGAQVRDYLTGRYPSLAEEVASVKDINDIFDRMDAIIRTIVENTSEADFTAHIRSLREGVGG